MVANLYLHPNAFEYNGVDSRQAVKDKLVALVGDMKEVVYLNNEENIFKLTNTFAETEIFEDESIVDFVASELGYEERGIFFTMMANIADDFEGLSFDQLKEKCRYDSQEKDVNSIVILNNPQDLPEKAGDAVRKDYISFDVYELVYNKHSWLHLRRQILGNHPKDPRSFIHECRKYFPNLVFHDNCVISLDDGVWKYLEMVPRRIVYYLACLNDKFEEVRKKFGKSNPNDILANFSGIFGLDRSGSLQQNPDKKSAITFGFKSETDGKVYPVLCEPHLKIDHVDSNQKVRNINTRRFNPRIYFCYSSPEIANGKILIGSIGKHI